MLFILAFGISFAPRLFVIYKEYKGSSSSNLKNIDQLSNYASACINVAHLLNDIKVSSSVAQ